MTGLLACQLAGGGSRRTVVLWPARVLDAGISGAPDACWVNHAGGLVLNWGEMSMSTRSEPMPELLDRQRERAALDGLLGDVRAGRGRALVVRGEAGVGKSALLEYMAGAASGMQVVRAAGVESEMELAFAGVHQLCAPLLAQLEGLPVPQRDALGVAFGLREGGAPDRFMIGLAVLT